MYMIEGFSNHNESSRMTEVVYQGQGMNAFPEAGMI